MTTTKESGQSASELDELGLSASEIQRVEVKFAALRARRHEFLLRTLPHATVRQVAAAFGVSHSRATDMLCEAKGLPRPSRAPKPRDPAPCGTRTRKPGLSASELDEVAQIQADTRQLELEAATARARRTELLRRVSPRVTTGELSSAFGVGTSWARTILRRALS
jgi:hypothetical protein